MANENIFERYKRWDSPPRSDLAEEIYTLAKNIVSATENISERTAQSLYDRGYVKIPWVFFDRENDCFILFANTELPSQIWCPLEQTNINKIQNNIGDIFYLGTFGEIDITQKNVIITLFLNPNMYSNELTIEPKKEKLNNILSELFQAFPNNDASESLQYFSKDSNVSFSESDKLTLYVDVS